MPLFWCFRTFKPTGRRSKQRAPPGTQTPSQSSNGNPAAPSAPPNLVRQHFRTWQCCGANDPSWEILQNLRADDAIAFYGGKEVQRQSKGGKALPGRFEYTDKLRIVRLMPNAEPGMFQHVERYLQVQLSQANMNQLTTALDHTPERGGVIKFKLRFDKSSQIWTIEKICNLCSVMADLLRPDLEEAQSVKVRPPLR